MLTVLLPVRDARPFLLEALESLSEQTLRRWRCLVWDDGSRDGSRGLVERHARQDPRFCVLGRSEPVGVAGALQELLSRVDTPWVARMDADDRCLPERLECAIDAARADPGVALWGTLVGSLGEPGEGWTRYLEWLNGVAEEGDLRAHAFTECPLPHPTWLGRTEVLRAAGGYRQGSFPEDYDLFLRLLRAGARFGKVRQIGLLWRDHPNRETRTSSRTHRDAFLRLKAHHFAEGLRSGQLSHLPRKPIAIWGAGRTGRTLANEILQKGLSPECFVDPVKAGIRTFGLPVVEPEAAPPGRHLVLVAVGPHPLRQELAERFAREGRVFERDYIWMY